MKFLQDTQAALSADTTISPDVKDALLSRLEFRTQFLKTTELAGSRTSPEIKGLWTDLLALSLKLKSSAHLGTEFSSSFSVKIQRKLASTVPPRPIVHVSQEAAFSHLENLCKDGSAVVDVLRYYDSQSLLVNCSSSLLGF